MVIQKITHWLLITLILTLGFGQLLRFDFFGIPIYLHDVLIICILVLQGQALQVDRRYLQGLALKNIGLLLFLSGLTLSWLRALTLYPISSLLVPFLYTLRLLAYLTLYLSLKKQQITIPRSIFLCAGLIALLIGLIQYFAMPDMRVFEYLGWDDHLSRLILPHFDPTFTAVMLGLFVLYILKLRPLYAISNTLFASIGILLTYSRSVWLSLLLTIMFSIRNKKIILLIVSTMLMAILFLPKRFGEGTNLFRTFSIESRFVYDMKIIRDLNWNLITGVGMNTLALNKTSEKGYPNHATGPNNSYIYLLSTVGVVGLVGWGMFLAGLYKESHYKPMIIFFCIASLFNNVMFYPFALLWVLVAETMVPSEA